MDLLFLIPLSPHSPLTPLFVSPQTIRKFVCEDTDKGDEDTDKGDRWE